MKLIFEQLAARADLSREEARDTMEHIMEGRLSDAQIAAFLFGLRTKGESTDELLGCIDAMRAKAVCIRLEDPDAVDLCGTGGDHAGTFNISTVTSFVVAGGGVTVAKHGNRSVSSSSGSADVLRELGVNIDVRPEQSERCINSIGIGFLFAPVFHPAMRFASKARAELGIKTCMNMLGPMLNPAGVRRQLVGTFSPHAATVMADVFERLHPERVCLVHSDDGLDEVSLGAMTHVLERGKSAKQSAYHLEPSAFGLQSTPKGRIQGGNPAENASITLEVLNGGTGPHRDTVVANASLGFLVADRVTTIEEGVALAQESIDSGHALDKLNKLKEMTNR